MRVPTTPSPGLSLLIEVLLRELASMESVRDEALGLSRGSTSDRTAIRALGSTLHDYYNGAEKMFRRIADDLDRHRPEGEEWHRKLLEQMSLPLRDVRPPVVDIETHAMLRELLGFRHVFRKAYGHELQWERMVELAETLGALRPRLVGAVEDLSRFLEDAAASG